MVLDVGNTRVYPEKRGDGSCCRLETAIRKDNIAGLKVEVLIAGTLFVGELNEPVRGLKDPLKNVNQGIAFSKKPKAVKFDYKYSVGNQRVKSCFIVSIRRKGLIRQSFVSFFRNDGKIRMGTCLPPVLVAPVGFFTGTVSQWVNGAKFPVSYGDCTRLPEYDEKNNGLNSRNRRSLCQKFEK